jgi:hypothetical protein
MQIHRPDDLMHLEERIHKLSIQYKTGRITFRETVGYAIRQEPGGIDNRGGLARILHLHVCDEFDL